MIKKVQLESQIELEALYPEDTSFDQSKQDQTLFSSKFVTLNYIHVFLQGFSDGLASQLFLKLNQIKVKTATEKLIYSGLASQLTQTGLKRLNLTIKNGSEPELGFIFNNALPPLLHPLIINQNTFDQSLLTVFESANLIDLSVGNCV